MDDKMKAKLKPIFSMSIIKKPEGEMPKEEMPKEEDFNKEGMKAAAEEFISAVERKDADGLVSAFCSLIELYDEEPMTEEMPKEEVVPEEKPVE